MPTEVHQPGPKAEISKHGLFVILAATAIALLGTPLASPAMPEIARVFAQNAQNEPFARAILSAISILPGEANVIFLVKFILLSIPALFIILGAPLVGWLSDNIGRKRLLNISLLIFGLSGASGYFADSFFFMFVGRGILGLSIAGIKTLEVLLIDTRKNPFDASALVHSLKGDRPDLDVQVAGEGAKGPPRPSKR